METKYDGKVDYEGGFSRFGLNKVCSDLLGVIHLVSFSGGMGSFAEAKMCCDIYGKENVKLLFADTNMEDEDLYRFMDECVAFLGCDFEVIADGRTPFQVFKDQRYMGNSLKDPCSKILKRQLLTKVIRKNYTKDRVVVHVGIDFSENHRLPPIQERCAPWFYTSLLVENGIMVRKDYSEQFGIRKPRLYDWGLGHNNCKGFCPKAGLGHYKKLYEASPERYAEFEREEEEVYEVIGKPYPFLKRQRNGITERLTLKQYRLILEQDGVTKEEEFEFGGCGCAF